MLDKMPISQLRACIDKVDSMLIFLLSQRARLSARVQETRLAGKGPRVDYRREGEVCRRFRDRLGEGGEGVAEAVLRLCRGNESACSPRDRATSA
ncbi:chorismate mutase [Streptomyces longwoodensis]|uniref:chorismate mutase n=1 Tax=Streptomyces longwoodensis TaxID=68231 RepID=UPI00340D5053